MEKLPLNSFPLVSICIPCFNAEKYIEETISCLTDQDYPNLEIIVIDDHSTDQSAKIIKALASLNQNLMLAKAEKKGAAAARNQAFNLTKGDYIVFFDADDLIEPHFITSQLKALNGRVDDCVISAWGRFIGTKDTFTLDHTDVRKDLSFHDWIINYWTTAANMTIPGRLLMSRKLVKKTGGWNEELSLNDDFQFFSQLFSRVETIRYNIEGVLLYRSNVNGLSSKTGSYTAQTSNLKAILDAIDAALLKFDDLTVKQACVNLLQHFIYDIYPHHRSLEDIAKRRIKTISIRPTIEFKAGGYTKILSRLIGWKNTKRIKDIIS